MLALIGSPSDITYRVSFLILSNGSPWANASNVSEWRTLSNAPSLDIKNSYIHSHLILWGDRRVLEDAVESEINCTPQASISGGTSVPNGTKATMVALHPTVLRDRTIIPRRLGRAVANRSITSLCVDEGLLAGNMLQREQLGKAVFAVSVALFLMEDSSILLPIIEFTVSNAKKQVINAVFDFRWR